MKGKWLAAAAGILVFGIAVAALCTGKQEQLPEFTQPPEETQPLPVFGEEPAQTQLPWRSEDGTLEAEQLMAYPDTGQAALMIRNTGSRGITFACITLKQAEKSLYFFVTWLPPGSRVLVPEYSGKPFSDDPVTQCRCAMVRWARFTASHEEIHMALAEPEQLALTNLSGRMYSCVVVRYRFWNEELQCFLGGSAGAVFFPALEAGECRRQIWEQGAVIVAVELK